MSFLQLILGMVGIVIIFLIVDELIFQKTHRDPLTESEVDTLAGMRRDKGIKQYFLFSSVEYSIDKGFKSRMKTEGRLYSSDENLENFPSVAASMLKYKKHEWIVIGFEKGKKIGHLWVNKGESNSQAHIGLGYDTILEIAKNHSCSSVLLFHNHPNSDPNNFTFNKPSETDINSANALERVLIPNGVNLLEFVCERGRSYMYYFSCAESFLPKTEYTKEIKLVNGLSVRGNLRLQRELLKRWIF